MPKKLATAQELDILLEQAQLLIKKTKSDGKKKPVVCKKCGLKKKIYVRGQCEECYLDGRAIKETIKLGKRWISTNGREYTYTLVEGKSEPVVRLYSRVRMAEIIGRPLHPYEIVSHRDGDRTNNSDDNLYLTLKAGVDLGQLRCSCGRSYLEEMKAAASLKEENSPITSSDATSLTRIVMPSFLSDK